MCDTDIDKYYNDLLKNAIKYGMNPNEFWHSDLNDYYAYELAYVEKLHETTHLQGYYNYLGLQTIFSNMFKKSGEKVEEYPKENLYTIYQKGESKKAQQTNNFSNPNDRDDFIEKEFRNKMLMFY